MRYGRDKERERKGERMKYQACKTEDCSTEETVRYPIHREKKAGLGMQSNW